MKMLQCGDRQLPWGKRTLVMGIVNVTPDSFSDGGHYLDVKTAVEHACGLLKEGADILDIGGESTRPYATPVAPEEECARVLPVVKQLVAMGIRHLSIDTRNAFTAQACLDAGASWVNDVSALTYDERMLKQAKRADAVILMHARGTPQTMQMGSLACSDIVGMVAQYLTQRVKEVVTAGISLERLIVDPGIGFGKTTEQDLMLLSHMRAFAELGVPVLAGSSRKKMIGALTGIEVPAERDVPSLATLALSVLSGAHIVRVHQVKMAKQVLAVLDASKAVHYEDLYQAG